MIVLNNVSRWYGQVIGLNDVSCSIGPGVTALLGMNGAGKSTLMRVITGQIRPTTGTISVFGHEPFANPQVYKHLGYCPEIDNFYEGYSGRQFVYTMGRLQNFSHEAAKKRTEECLVHVGMHERADRKIKGYSKGMRQRIKLAQAMFHEPDVILLDEPLNGLDPVGRHEYIELLHSLAKQGKTVIVSSHILFEVEQMTRSILLLHRGRLLASGDLTVIRELMDKYPHRVRIETPHARALASSLVEKPYLLNLKFDRDGVEMQVKDPDIFYTELPQIVNEKQAHIIRMHSPDNNLESIFRYLVGDAS